MRLSLSESLVRRNFCKDMVKLFESQEKFFSRFKKLSNDAGFRAKFFFERLSKKYVAAYFNPPRKPRDAIVMRAMCGLCGRSAGYVGAMRAMCGRVRVRRVGYAGGVYVVGVTYGLRALGCGKNAKNPRARGHYAPPLPASRSLSGGRGSACNGV